jgi:hypothetical protein
MINVVHQEAEVTVRHTLKIDQIDLSTHVESPGDYRSQTCSWTIPLLTFNALGASIGE